SVGMVASGSASLDNFKAWPLTTGLDYFDPFTQHSTVLGDPWQNQVGTFQTTNNQLVVGLSSGGNLATLNAANQADVDVRATLYTNLPGETAGLVARYQGSGDQNYSLGQVVSTTTGFTATLLVNRKGVNKTLATATVLATSNTGFLTAFLRLVVTGT